MSDTNVAGTSTLARAIAIVTRPTQIWPVIAAEETRSGAVFRSYVLPLALIGPLCGFIGGQLFGTAAYGTLGKAGVLSQLVGASVALVLALLCYLILTAIADSLSPRFGGNVAANAASRLIAYGSTPVWLSGLFSLVPSLAPLSILGLYSIVLIYKGVTPVMGVPKDRAGGYTIALVLCGLVLNIAVLALSVVNMNLIRGMGLMD